MAILEPGKGQPIKVEHAAEEYIPHTKCSIKVIHFDDKSATGIATAVATRDMELLCVPLQRYVPAPIFLLQHGPVTERPGGPDATVVAICNKIQGNF